MIEANAWAVIAMNGKVYIKSVSPTRRAAIVNWLVVEKDVDVRHYHTDIDIENMWRQFGQYVDCREVIVQDANHAHNQ